MLSTVIDLQPVPRSTAVLGTGILLAVAGAVLIGINLFYYTFIFQISSSALWAVGVICIGLYLYKGKETRQRTQVSNVPVMPLPPIGQKKKQIPRTQTKKVQGHRVKSEKGKITRKIDKKKPNRPDKKMKESPRQKAKKKAKEVAKGSS